MDYVQSMFEEFGWYPKRRKNVDYVIDDLKRLGFSAPTPDILNLLCEYGNLGGTYKSPFGFVKLFINVDKGIASIPNEDIRTHETNIREILVPIGTISEDVTLIVSHKMRFYIDDFGDLYFLGNTLYEAIHTLLKSINENGINLPLASKKGRLG